MSRTIYVYGEREKAAIAHLVAFTPLAHATTSTDTTWAGEDCIRLELTTPLPSTGEGLLWKVAQSLNDGGPVDLHACRAYLDMDSLEAVHAAVGLAFGVAGASA